MCATCNKINKRIDEAPMGSVDLEKALADIAAAIKKGRSYSHFEKLTNRLLGTEMSPRDRALEKRWQDSQEEPE